LSLLLGSAYLLIFLCEVPIDKFPPFSVLVFKLDPFALEIQKAKQTNSNVVQNTSPVFLYQKTSSEFENRDVEYIWILIAKWINAISHTESSITIDIQESNQINPFIVQIKTPVILHQKNIKLNFSIG